MNLEKKVKKLMEEGYKDSEKDKEKMLEVLLFYAKSHDMKINYARLTYECIFDLNCREAEELNIDLWVHLSTKFKIPEKERYLIKPPDKLKNKKKRQDWIKWLFYPFFFEWKFNNFTNPITYAFSKGVLSYRKRGKKRGEQETQERIARQEPIIQERKELIDSGVKYEKEIIKRIKKALPKESYDYIQKTILVEKRKNGGS